MLIRRCRINGVRETYKAACCIGRQPDSNIWVVGPDLQLNDNGEVVNEEDTFITWVKDIFELGHRSAKILPRVQLPLSSLALGDVVKSLFSTLHNNGPAAVFTIGMYFLTIDFID